MERPNGENLAYSEPLGAESDRQDARRTETDESSTKTGGVGRTDYGEKCADVVKGWKTTGEDPTQRNIEFWLKNLSGAPERLQLPTDLPQVASAAHTTAQVQMTLSAALAEQLRASSREANVTPFVTLLTGWAVLLGRWAGQDDLVIVTPGGGQDRPEIAPLTRITWKTVPLRISLKGRPTFEELMARVQNAVASACAHQDAPLERVLTELKVACGTSSAYNVMVRFQGAASAPTEPQREELGLSIASGDNTITQFDLLVSMTEERGGLAATLQYRSDLFRRETIERMAGCWEVLLQELTTAVCKPIDQLPILGRAEHDQIVYRFNDTTEEHAQSLIHELFERQVEGTPDAIAVSYETKFLTYAELNGRANQLAWFLRRRGVRQEHRVAICVERGLEMVVGVLATLKAGAAYVPLDPSYPQDLLTYMLEDAAPSALLIQQSFKDALTGMQCPTVRLDSQWSEIKEYGQQNPDPRILGLTSKNLAYLIYTSGSTGRPKGVMVDHGNVVNLWRALERVIYCGVADCKRIGVNASIAFDSAGKQLIQLLSGRSLYIVPQSSRVDAREFLKFTGRHQLDCLDCTPTQLSSLIGAGLLDAPQIVPRAVLVGGEDISQTLWTQLSAYSDSSFYNVYGPTECTVDATVALIRESPERRTIGRPIANAQIYILDQCLQPVPIGVVGEIYIAGGGLGRGYHNRPELTSERFRPNPFSKEPGARMYRTGDLGRWDSDGRIRYSGRNDRQVKVRGYRIEMGEIETRMRRYAGVREAVVVQLEDGMGEKRLVGYAVPDFRRLKEQERVDSGDGEAVDEWKRVHDQTYSTAADRPSFVGWNSSYTGKPIPEAQMQEWLLGTLERLRALKPRKVLEIGCGIGLLLERLAPHCEVYRGIDFSGEALERLRRWMRTRDDLGHVELEQCSALAIGARHRGAYDTAILNSVVQYFPDAVYLRTVLQHAAELTSAGGHIFVGDVRHLGLLRVFHSSVQIETAEPGTTLGRLRKRVARACDQEKELVISPSFFRELRQEMPSISDVNVLLKRGRSDNELTNFRYDVVLEINGKRNAEKRSFDVWRGGDCSAGKVAEDMKLRESSCFVISGLKNRRLSRAVCALQMLETADESLTVEYLRDSLNRLQSEGQDPEEFWEVGEQYGYGCNVRWMPSCEDGSFEVIWTDPPKLEGSVEINAGPSTSYKLHTNDPWAHSLQQQMIAGLREYLGETLPSYMLPSAIVTLHELPLTPNGKLDHRRLPAPDDSSVTSREYEAPEGRTEIILAKFWQEILGLDRCGRHDDFFELGGNSIMGMRLVAKLSEEAGIELPYVMVFMHPTIEQLAQYIDGKL